MYLAGLRIPDEDVRELARLVDEPTRSFLEKALGLETESSRSPSLTVSASSGRSTMPGRTHWPSSAASCSRSTSGDNAKTSSSPLA